MTDIIYTTAAGYIEPGHRPLVDGLREAVQLSREFDSLMNTRRYWKSQLTPPQPLIPYKKPIKGFAKNFVLLLIIGAVMTFFVGPLATVLLSMSPTRPGELQIDFGGLYVQALGCVIAGIVLFFVIKGLWNRRIAKKNAIIAQKNESIQAANATPKPQDSYIYVNLQDVDAKLDQVKSVWQRNVGPWYPTSTYGYTEAAEYFYKVVSDGLALDTAKAAELYENDQARKQQQQQMNELLKHQREIAAEQRWQSIMGAWNTGVNMQIANNTQRLADRYAPKTKKRFF